MTPASKKMLIGLGAGVLLGAALVVGASEVLRHLSLWERFSSSPVRPATDAATGTQHNDASHETAAAHPDHAQPTISDVVSGPTPAGAVAPENSTVVSPERLQSIGVRFELATSRPVERTIRTVGRVEVDERRIAHVNVKFDGWISELMVNYTGERVRKGEVLFTLYSPELVATQQEYLLALQGRSRLGSSDFPEVAQGSQALVQVVQQRLRFWDIEESHIRDLERTGKILKTLPIHSPVSGTVIKKAAVVGMQTKPGEELYTIADLSRVWVLADIFEYELPLIAVGRKAKVTASSMPELSLDATAQFIPPTVDPETRSAKVRFELDNPDERIKPGMFTNLELTIPLGTRLVVPKDSVLETGERKLVFIHHGGGRLEWRTVRTGVRADDWVEILDGLKDGDHVITSANFLLDSESQLKAAMGGMKH